MAEQVVVLGDQHAEALGQRAALEAWVVLVLDDEVGVGDERVATVADDVDRPRRLCGVADSVRLDEERLRALAKGLEQLVVPEPAELGRQPVGGRAQ
jgi:hypothetical protein